ncbi:pyridoxamine 5'-phosphate oxidase family protein [uncultured Cellulomonas sp.]|uniref:pyridoxamine 5'-phosphate oxidase family protein n=1 Tax=uncultured Cellulomonas sp. TaxID=189682 RepID=UPI00345BB3AA
MTTPPREPGDRQPPRPDTPGPPGPVVLSDAGLAFVTDRHLATLSTVRRDGSPHVVPVAFTWDAARGRARITTRSTSVKARRIARGGPDGEPLPAALCQVDGRRWMTLEGTITLSDDPADVAEAVERYADRYRVLGEQPTRVVLHLQVARVLGTVR